MPRDDVWLGAGRPNRPAALERIGAEAQEQTGPIAVGAVAQARFEGADAVGRNVVDKAEFPFYHQIDEIAEGQNGLSKALAWRCHRHSSKWGFYSRPAAAG